MKVGDKVKILECHSIPDVVGREGEIVVEASVKLDKYPFRVMLAQPIKIKFNHPMLGEGEAETAGPFPFREDELELVGAGTQQPQGGADSQPGGTVALPDFLKGMEGEAGK